jgi:hydrogenase maturation protease
VVGVGSPWGDDAVAWEIVRRIQEANWQGQRPGDNDIEFQAVEGGQRLLDVLDGCGTLILIDALVCPDAPGTIHRLDWPDLRLEALHPGTTHQLRPVQTLRLAATLGLLPPRVVIWAVAGACFDPQASLSPKVAAAVPASALRIAAELEAIRRGGASDHS